MSDFDECTALLRGGSKSFHAASRLLPGWVRRPATALYAFCRVADDEVDCASTGFGTRSKAVTALRQRLDLIYRGTPAPVAADRAFAQVVTEYRIPQILPAALLDGFAWDAEGRRYGSYAELQDYAARVAGSVGAMMAVVMGVRSADVLARACELGVAMQLTNIARDVGEDARAGRLYLPLDWLAAEGVDVEAFLGAPSHTPAMQRVVARLLGEADRLYARAAPAIAHLPLVCRPGIHAARLLYAAIGHAAGASGFDPVADRAFVPARLKTALLAQGVADSFMAPGSVAGAPLPAIEYLVRPAATAGEAGAGRASPWNTAGERAVWVLELFATLEARQEALLFEKRSKNFC